MVPIFNIFGKEISVYMLMALIGALAVIFVAYKLAESYGADDLIMLNATLFAGIGVILGGHLLFGITNIKHFGAVFSKVDGVESFLSAVKSLFGGSVFYGGLLGAMLAVVIYLKLKKVRVLTYTDVLAPCIPMFHFFGRLGCFLSGCCFGVECSVGFVYENAAVPMANGVRRFPVQLVEAVLNLALCVVLFYLLKKRRCKGRLINIYLAVYPVYRFILEYFRGDDYRGFLFGLSTSQLISLLLLVANGAFMLYSYMKGRKKA